MRRPLALLCVVIGVLLAATGVLALLSIPQLLEFNSGAHRPRWSGGIPEYVLAGVVGLPLGIGLALWATRFLRPSRSTRPALFHTACSNVGLCVCPCHTSGGAVVHPVPCCSACPYCGHLVTSGSLAAHKSGGTPQAESVAGT